MNVFRWDKVVYPLRFAKSELSSRINVLLTGKRFKQHYTWIKNLNRLVNDHSKHIHCMFFCERYLNGYTRQDLLEQHKHDFRGIGHRANPVEMPEKRKNKLTLQNYQNQLKVPYVIYEDFESLINNVEGPSCDPNKSNTQKTAHHEACGFSYIVVQCDGEIEQPVVYRRPNATQHFLESPQREEARIKNIKQIKPHRDDDTTLDRSQNAKDRHICDKHLFVDIYRDIIYGVDPNTGKHKEAANKKCCFQCPTMIGPKAKRKTKGDDTDICYICDKSLIMKNYRDCFRDHCDITGQN